MQSNFDADFLRELVTSHNRFWITWKTDGSKKAQSNEVKAF